MRLCAGENGCIKSIYFSQIFLLSSTSSNNPFSFYFSFHPLSSHLLSFLSSSFFPCNILCSSAESSPQSPLCTPYISYFVTLINPPTHTHPDAYIRIHIKPYLLRKMSFSYQSRCFNYNLEMNFFGSRLGGKSSIYRGILPTHPIQ